LGDEGQTERPPSRKVKKKKKSATFSTDGGGSFLPNLKQPFRATMGFHRKGKNFGEDTHKDIRKKGSDYIN